MATNPGNRHEEWEAKRRKEENDSYGLHKVGREMDNRRGFIGAVLFFAACLAVAGIAGAFRSCDNPKSLK
jgi:hypothetical protein